MNVRCGYFTSTLLTDREPMVYGHVTEQKRSYDGIVANESDVLHPERPRLRLGHIKSKT